MSQVLRTDSFRMGEHDVKISLQRMLRVLVQFSHRQTRVVTLKGLCKATYRANGKEIPSQTDTEKSSCSQKWPNCVPRQKYNTLSLIPAAVWENAPAERGDAWKPQNKRLLVVKPSSKFCEESSRTRKS